MLRALYFSILATCLPSFAVQAQSAAGRIYYDKNWNIISGRDSAAFYREYTPGNDKILVKDYYISGKLQMSGAIVGKDSLKTGVYNYYNEKGYREDENHYLNGRREGTSKSFYPDGRLAYEALYKDNFRSGYCKSYDSTGKVIAKEYYIEDPVRVRHLLTTDTTWTNEKRTADDYPGLQEGKSFYYHPNGQLAAEELFENGKLVSANFFDPAGRIVYYPHLPYSTQSAPRFKSGDYNVYLIQHVQYPKEARKREIEGKVYIDFIIETDGSIKYVKVTQSVHPLLDQAAANAVKSSSGMWEPGKMHNLPLRARYVVPVNFMLE
ncbi:energy transducer TonB [Edaphocola aurantiacus]|uniref:energy transducer TonB n=1 Tax=Edaphocola aurantiacus TaxID=2601682 RepID=UPI001C96C353|nr:energy transducer TonB [Edaphocola aurantiacus]